MRKTIQQFGLAAALTFGSVAPSFAQAPAPAAAQPVAAAQPAAAATAPAATPATASAPAAAAPSSMTPPPGVAIPAGITPPADYIIGAEDVLSIVFWRDKEISSDVIVRPDGRISLPLINEVVAGGLTPEQLRASLTQAANKYIEDPSVTVVVKAINSRRVFITGQVAKPGPYSLGAPTTVLQMIATAGGVGEYSKSDRIVIMRTENGKTTSYKFNYKQVTEGRNLQQNIELKSGDTIIVP